MSFNVICRSFSAWLTVNSTCSTFTGLLCRCLARLFRACSTMAAAKVQSSPSSSSRLLRINLGGLSKSISKLFSLSSSSSSPLRLCIKDRMGGRRSAVRDRSTASRSSEVTSSPPQSLRSVAQASLEQRSEATEPISDWCSGSAPASSSVASTLTLPLAAASKTGVSPTASAELGSDLASSSRRTSTRSPMRAAKANGDA
mmetsp:Transcript_68797/g.151568  ORF Transcript_68797/g.151568 Transcript_68797/m.151568 type:complete len:200 (-) Transcript_68797:178-777(-)